jgi:hypothetical protein
MTNADFGLRPKYRFLEFKIDIFPEIGSPLRTRPLAGTATEDVANAEYVSEDIAEILESSPAKASTTKSVATQSSMTKAIIRGSLLAVAQDSVGFTRLFELLFSVGVIGIAVGMKLQSELSISALNLLFGGFSGDPKNLIVITFYVTSQNYLPTISRDSSL